MAGLAQKKTAILRILFDKGVPTNLIGDEFDGIQKDVIRLISRIEAQNMAPTTPKVGRCDGNSAYINDRICELHAAGWGWKEVADQLNLEGFKTMTKDAVRKRWDCRQKQIGALVEGAQGVAPAKYPDVSPEPTTWINGAVQENSEPEEAAPPQEEEGLDLDYEEAFRGADDPGQHEEQPTQKETISIDIPPAQDRVVTPTDKIISEQMARGKYAGEISRYLRVHGHPMREDQVRTRMAILKRR
jgi:hypothetical protein